MSSCYWLNDVIITITHLQRVKDGGRKGGGEKERGGERRKGGREKERGGEVYEERGEIKATKILQTNIFIINNKFYNHQNYSSF